MQRALKAGVRILQLRCKGLEDGLFLNLAQRFRRLTKINNALFLINDRIDIAFFSKADGVHLGQDDLPVALARKILGKDKIIGKSTHSLTEAVQAQSEKVDYIGFGPIFRTETKPDRDAIGPDAIKQLIKHMKIPFFAIGGINQNNIRGVISAGAKRIAVFSAILSKKDSGQATRDLLKQMGAD